MLTLSTIANILYILYLHLHIELFITSLQLWSTFFFLPAISILWDMVIRQYLKWGLLNCIKKYIYTLHSWRRCPARPDGDIRPEAILSTSFGSSRTATHHQVTCTCQIWISGWILAHFDVRTISVASKLKKLQIFFVNNTRNPNL